MKPRTARQLLSKLAEHADLIRIIGWAAGVLAALGIAIWLSTTATHQPRQQAIPPTRSSAHPPPAPTQPLPPMAGPPTRPAGHTARPGDTLAGIALRHDVPFELIASHNAIANPNRIVAGTQLGIPTRPFGVVVIPRGATLGDLAARYGLSRARLHRLNPELTNPNRIQAGGLLRVGAATTTAVSA